LEVNSSIVIDEIRVTVIDANHCPGAVCFLFSLPDGRRILHTGDFRWDAHIHGIHPELKDGISVLILDTTYLMPKFVFPTQRLAIEKMVDALREEHAANPKTLFVCMSYHIGKERAYFGAADALGWKIWASHEKCKVLRLLDLPSRWMSMLTDHPEEAQMHVLGMGQDIHAQALADRIAGTAWERVVIIKPTGWTFRPRKPDTLERREDGCVVTLGVPYSEHSSYPELRDCVRMLRPKRVIPTVAGDSAKARALVDRIAELMDLSEDRSRLDAYYVLANRKKPRKSVDEDFDLGSVDVEEQRQLWERISQRKKLGNRSTPERITGRLGIRAFLVPKSN
jgi:DNA cross-link repair 1A protein